MARVVREWTLLEEVGRGGMGVVYSATHEILTGAWAVKVIRPELSEDKESRLRFLQEASILARMQHPNIVATQTPFLEGGQIYLPMEYLSGQSLEQILKADGTLWSAERAVNIIRQVAAGLGYAHRQSPAVLHRDIKPGNIQLLDDGGVKVLDFGLARTLGDKSMTGTGKAVGTPAYMAPELLEGKKASPRSDIYSLGVVLYRLLAGRLPYDMPEEDSSIQAVFMAVARGLDRGLPDVREFAALTPTALANLTMSTLSRASEGRPADGADLAGLLGRVDTRPLLPKSQNMAEYSADSTRLGIDLNSVTGKKPAMDNGSGIERSSPTPGNVKLVPKQEDADSSLIGLDLPGAGAKPREMPVHSALEPAKEGRKVDSVKTVVEPSQSRKSWRLPAVLAIALLSVVAVVVALAGRLNVTQVADPQPSVDPIASQLVSPGEIKMAYAKLIELQKAASPASVDVDPAVKINADFTQKLQALQRSQAWALRAIDDEQAKAKDALPKAKGKKAEASSAAAAAKLDEEFNWKKNDAAQGFAPQFASLNKAKADALKAAANAKAKADSDTKAQVDKDLAAYLDKAVKDSTTKAKIDCQMNAAKLDDFNKCK